MPIPVAAEKWNVAPDAGLMAHLQDGRTNLLFVGRIAPNKKQDDLVVAFEHYLQLDRDARLILVGTAEESDAYAAHLLELIAARNLQESVVVTGSITEAQLQAYYRTAHLLWSMSEHEGFACRWSKRCGSMCRCSPFMSRLFRRHWDRQA